MTVAEMGARMSYLEFVRWHAFYRREAAELEAVRSGDAGPGGHHREKAKAMARQAIRVQKGRR